VIKKRYLHIINVDSCAYNNLTNISKLHKTNPPLSFVAALKDTVLVAVFCVLLHPLQMLLVALEAPGVVLELRAGSIAPLQTVVEHVGLLEPLLLAFHTAGVKTEAGQPD